MRQSHGFATFELLVVMALVGLGLVVYAFLFGLATRLSHAAPSYLCLAVLGTAVGASIGQRKHPNATAYGWVLCASFLPAISSALILLLCVGGLLRGVFW
jgi:hypothetical protein